jgi:hypothetical protein
MDVNSLPDKTAIVKPKKLPALERQYYLVSELSVITGLKKRAIQREIQKKKNPCDLRWLKVYNP